MNGKRVLTIALRVIRQVIRDRRTVALIVLGPILIITLGSLLFRAKQAKIPLGVVDQDQGITSPVTGSLNLGQRIVEELDSSDSLSISHLSRSEADDRLKDGTVQAVVLFPEDFTQGFLKTQQVILDLRLEGSDPVKSRSIQALVAQGAMKGLANLGNRNLNGGTGGSGGELQPVNIQTTYLYGGREFDTFDYVAPVYIATIVMFFVFLLACVAFLRERSQGTMERLAATPTTRGEIVLGYMIGLGIFALLQAAVILFFTVWVLDIHFYGSLAILFLIIALLALVGVTMGIQASAFARTEFQVLQFIPLLILPQVLLGGTFWAVADMPVYLQPLAYVMPLYYANMAMRDVMLKGWSLAEIWPYLAVLIGITMVFILLSTLMMRREVA